MPEPRIGTTARLSALPPGVIVMVPLLMLGLFLWGRHRRPGLPVSPAASTGTSPVTAAKPGRQAPASALRQAAGRRGPLEGTMMPTAFVDAGFATPEAAVVTFIWALTHGNIDVAGQALALDDHGRSTIDAFLARLPPDVAARYRPPEQFIALLWAGEWADAGELAGAKVLDARRTGSTASVRLECQFVGGRKYRFRLNLAHSAAGWQTQVESSLVDGFISNYFLEPQMVSRR